MTNRTLLVVWLCWWRIGNAALDEHTEHSLLQTQAAVRCPLQTQAAVRCPLQTQAAVRWPPQTQAAAEAGVHLWARADMMKEDDRPGLDTGRLK